MAAYYKVHSLDGQFTHAKGKPEALRKANSLADWPRKPLLTERELRKSWGITITKITTLDARAVGLA